MREGGRVECVREERRVECVREGGRGGREKRECVSEGRRGSESAQVPERDAPCEQESLCDRGREGGREGGLHLGK